MTAQTMALGVVAVIGLLLVLDALSTFLWGPDRDLEARWSPDDRPGTLRRPCLTAGCRDEAHR